MWHPYILFDLARCIGVLLKIDENTVAGEFGHYVWVLIEVDLASSLSGYILLNRDGCSIMMNLFYKNLPDFYNACNSIGHANANCQIFDTKKMKHDMGKGEPFKRKVYRPKEKTMSVKVLESVEGLGKCPIEEDWVVSSVSISNRFEILEGAVSGSKFVVNQSCADVQGKDLSCKFWMLLCNGAGGIYVVMRGMMGMNFRWRNIMEFLICLWLWLLLRLGIFCQLWLRNIMEFVTRGMICMVVFSLGVIRSYGVPWFFGLL